MSTRKTNSGKQSIRRQRTPPQIPLDYLQQRRLNTLMQSLRADQSYD